MIGDILDQMGYMKQFLSYEIKSMRKSMKVVGQAMPCSEQRNASGPCRDRTDDPQIKSVSDADESMPE